MTVDAITLSLLLMQAPPPPPDEFARFPGEAVLSSSPATPQTTLRKARKFRTVLREAAARGPNFNGHYRTVYWGCGTNCIDWAVINLTDGAVWFAPEPVVSCWAPAEPKGIRWPDWIEGRVHSRLLYVHSCSYSEERTFDRRTVYEWQRGQIVLLRTEPFRGDQR